MKNHKQLLADFYLALLTIPEGAFRTKHQRLYACVRSAIADELDENWETIQTIFEKMAAKDRN